MKKVALISIVLNICFIIGIMIYLFNISSMNYNNLPQNSMLEFVDAQVLHYNKPDKYIERLNKIHEEKQYITEDLAKRIAEDALKRSVGKWSIEYNPYSIAYNEEHQVWIIYGELANGGTPYIFIHKYDGKIIEIGISTDTAGLIPIEELEEFK